MAEEDYPSLSLSTFPYPAPIRSSSPPPRQPPRPRVTIPQRPASLSSITGFYPVEVPPQSHPYSYKFSHTRSYSYPHWHSSSPKAMADRNSPGLLTSPIDPQTMPQPVIHSFPARLSGTTTYVVIDPVTEEAAIINPVLDLDPLSNEIRTRSADRLLKFVNDEGLTVKFILETTLHRDRISACRYLQLMLKHIGDGVVPKVCVGENSFCTCGDDDDDADDDSRPTSAGSSQKGGPEAFDKLFDDGEQLRIGNMIAKCDHLDDHEGVNYSVAHLIFSSTALSRTDGQDSVHGVINHPEPPPDKTSPVSSRAKPSIDEVLGSAEKLSLDGSPSPSGSGSGSGTDSPPEEPQKPPQMSPMLAFYAEQVNTRGGRIPRKINMPLAQRKASLPQGEAERATNGVVNGAPPDNGKGKQRERAPSASAPVPLRIPRKLGVIMC